MSDSVTNVEKIYDDYANYYNEAGSTIKAHISVLADFSKIEEAVRERVRELHEMLHEALISVIDLIESISDEDIIGKEEIKDEVLNVLKFYEGNSVIHPLQLNDILYLREEINKLFEGLEGKGQQLGIDLLILSMESIIPKLSQTQNHKTVFWYLNGKIIDEHYPSKLKMFDELDDNEKNRMNSTKERRGRNFSKEISQINFQEIVDEIIGDKSNKRYFHQSGTNKGNPNISQIAQHIAQTYPELVNGYGDSPDNGVDIKTIKRGVERALKKTGQK